MSFVDWFMASFLYCFPYSYCDSNSCCSFTLLKALVKSNGNLIAIAFKREKERQLSLLQQMFKDYWYLNIFKISPFFIIKPNSTPPVKISKIFYKVYNCILLKMFWLLNLMLKLIKDKLKTHMMRNHGYTIEDIKATFKHSGQGRQRSSILVNR